MASTMTSLATTGTSTGATARRPYAISPDLALEASARSSQRVSRDLLINMYRLGMLAQVVET